MSTHRRIIIAQHMDHATRLWTEATGEATSADETPAYLIAAAQTQATMAIAHLLGAILDHLENQP